VVRTIRVIRMVRILKLGFFAHYMLIFSEALEYAKHSFGMLGILFLFPLVIFACLTFSVEVGFGTKLISIFDAMYFVVATMTTLGYGDQYPITATGKVIVCFTVLTGIIYITLAIQMIGNCFDKAYGNYLIRFADRKRSAALRLGQVVGNNRRSSWHSIFAASELSLTSSSRERRSTYKATLPNSGFEQMQLRVPALKKFSVDCSPDSNAKSEESTWSKGRSNLISTIESLVVDTRKLSNTLQLLKIKNISKERAAYEILHAYDRLQQEISKLL